VKLALFSKTFSGFLCIKYDNNLIVLVIISVGGLRNVSDVSVNDVPEQSLHGRTSNPDKKKSEECASDKL
jgi:hypothetical protein